MDIEKAIELIREKYAEAQKLSFVYDPVGWAVYQVWSEHLK